MAARPHLLGAANVAAAASIAGACTPQTSAPNSRVTCESHMSCLVTWAPSAGAGVLCAGKEQPGWWEKLSCNHPSPNERGPAHGTPNKQQCRLCLSIKLKARNRRRRVAALSLLIYHKNTLPP